MTKTNCTSAKTKAQAKHEKYLARALKIHGDKYDYSQALFSSSTTRVKIKCKTCATVFTPTVSKHVNDGSGCPQCAKEETRKKLKGKRKKHPNISDPEQRAKHEKHLAQAADVHGKSYDYSLAFFGMPHVKTTIICKDCGEKFQQKPHSHVHLGHGCPVCATKRTSRSKKQKTWFTRAEFIELSRKKHGDKYDYSLVSEGLRTKSEKVIILCRKCGGEFNPAARNHYALGSGCPQCAHPSKRKTTAQFIAEARSVHGEKYDYSNVKYERNNKKVVIKCPEHGPFRQSPSSHVSLKNGCPQCAGNVRYTKARFIGAARIKHGNKYGYDRVVFKPGSKKIEIYCVKGRHYFEQNPSDHLAGKGCLKCAKNRKRTLAEFIKDAKKVHGDKYDYSQAKYEGVDRKLTINCPEHGPFSQSPTVHINHGSGCSACGEEQRRKEKEQTFKETAAKKHKGKYSYELVNYRDCREKVAIKCPEHGVFMQQTWAHLYGAGCPKCALETNSGWSRSDYIKYCKAKSKGRALLYVIKCQDDNETFYKIGITARSVESRFSRPSTMPYDFEVIREIEGDAGDIYDMETQFHRMNREKHYTPQKPFGGSVLECFSEITDDARFLLDVI